MNKLEGSVKAEKFFEASDSSSRKGFPAAVNRHHRIDLQATPSPFLSS
jgi:hypothetical protein